MSRDDGRPQEVEVKDFFYKQMRKLRVFNSPQELITARSSLLAVSNQYGVVYVAGDNNCVKAIKVETVEKLFIEVQGSLQVEEVSFPSTDVDVGYPFSHIALSCDDLTLAMCFERDGTCLLGFIDVRAFYSTKSPKKLFSEVVLSSGNAGVKVRQITWNPSFTDIVAVLLTDGQVILVKLTGSVATVSASLQGTTTAVSWSPKGKQIVAGLKDGSLVQLTHDFQKKKEIASPTILQNPSQVSDLVWISTFQFGTVYTECDDSDTSRLIIVNSPKNGVPSYEMFDDVYYGMGEDREQCFYLNYLAEWKLILSLYSGAYEVITVNQTDQGPWVKWVLPDSGQAVLPTTHDNEETYPLGLAVTFAVTKPLEQDDQKFPPAPILFMLTTDGVLCPFYIVYRNPKLAPRICHPPQPLALDGERLATSTGVPKPAGSLASQTAPVAMPPTTTITPPITQATNPPATTSTPITASKHPILPDNINAPQLGFSPLAGAQPNTTPLTFGPSKTAQATKPATASTPITTSKPSVLTDNTKAPQFGSTPFTGTPSSATPPTFGPTKTFGANLAGLPTNPGTVSFSPVSLPASAKPGQTGLFQFRPPQAAPLSQSGSGFGSTLPKSGPHNFVQSTASTPSSAQSSGGLGMTKPTEPSVPLKTGPTTKSTIPSTTKAPEVGGATPVKTPPVTNAKPPPAVQPTPNQGTPVGVNKDGVVPTSKEESKEKPRPKASPSKQELLEAAMHRNIHNEVEAFNKEMEEARNRYDDLRTLDVLLRELNTQGISKQVNSNRRFMNQVKSTVEGLKDDVNRAKNSLLDAFELVEDAKTRDNTATDPRYLQLLKNRGLDPSSERKMKEIRSSYLHLDNTLREVNMALDEQWDKENKQTRKMQSPCLDTIYQTMRQNRSIVKNQSLQLEAISKRVNNGSLRTNRWDRKGDSISGSEDVLSLSDRLRKQKLNTSTKEADNVSARKKSELRQMLSNRSTVPVRKTTFISDWRSRKDSSAGSFELETSSEAEESSQKEEKPPMQDSREAQKYSGKQSQFTVSKASVLNEQSTSVVHSTPKFGNGTSDFSFSKGFKPSSSFGDLTEKKPMPSKTAVPKENFTSQISKEKAVQPAQAASTANKVGQAAGHDKPSLCISPRDAAAAAAFARASSGASKLDLGASIPAKTLVEHKAEDGTKNISGKDPNADHQARLIADAAVKDAANKMKNVTQTPPSNTASTFTARSSSSAAQSSGPPVMVLQPGATFAMKKPGETPVFSAANPVLQAGKPVFLPGKPVLLAGKQVPQPETQTKGKNPTVAGFIPEKGGTSQSTGFSFKPPFDIPSFGSQPVFGGGAGGISGDGVSGGGVFGSGSTLFGNTGPLSFGITSKNQPSSSVVQSPSREEGAGGGKQDEADKTKSSLSTQTAPGSGNDNVARNMFDKTNLDDNKGSIVPVRGEPEGESKQPVVTVQRQAAIGKSDKDTPPATNVSTKTQSPPKTSSPSSTTATKPFMAGFSSPFSSGPFVFGTGDTKPSFGAVSTQVSTPSVSKATTEPSPPERTPVKTQPESQPAQRLQALGSGLTLTPPPFTSGFNSAPSLPNPTPQTTTPPLAASPPVQTNTTPPTTAAATTPTLGSTTTATATTATANPTFGATTTKPVFGSTEKPPLEAPKLDLNSTAESSEPSDESNTKPTSEVNKDINVVTASQPNTALQPAQPASLASPFSFGAGFGGNSATTSAPSTFGTSTLGSTAPSFQATQSKPDTPASNFTPAFGSSSFGGTSQSTGGFGMGNVNIPSETKPASGFGGGFSGLGGKPIEPNRNPFEVNPSPQSSDSSLFGNAAATSIPSPFQSPTSKPMFGSTGFGASSGNTGVGSTGFGMPSGTASSFGSPPSFGSNPTFGANPTFGGNPTFGASPAFGTAPAFGSPPSFGGAPTFGSEAGGTTFGGSPSFGNTGSSPSRIFGSGTETAGMFGNSPSTQAFGSLSSQSTIPSFGGLADGQNTAGMNQGQGFGSSMSGSSFSSYR